MVETDTVRTAYTGNKNTI